MRSLTSIFGPKPCPTPRCRAESRRIASHAVPSVLCLDRTAAGALACSPTRLDPHHHPTRNWPAAGLLERCARPPLRAALHLAAGVPLGTGRGPRPNGRLFCGARIPRSRTPAPVARRLPARGCCVALQARRWAICGCGLHSYAARVSMDTSRLYSYGLHSHGLYGHGWHSHALCGYRLCGEGLDSHSLYSLCTCLYVRAHVHTCAHRTPPAPLSVPPLPPTSAAVCVPRAVARPCSVFVALSVCM